MQKKPLKKSREQSRLLSKQKVIEDLFIEIDAFSGDPIIKAYLTYYLCIRVSGFMEDCIRSIFSEYVDANSKDAAKNFIFAKLKKIPNPTWGTITSISKEFDENWNSQLNKQVTKPYREALESIVSNRNVIAHGGTSAITLRDLETYYREAINVIDELEKICI